MDFEKEYRIEQDRIKHNIGLDRMILEKCEEKAPKKKISLRKNLCPCRTSGSSYCCGNRSSVSNYVW